MRLRAHVKEHLVPSMSYALHKGQMGRLGVIGGSVEYTGAPYYSAMAALRMGCDIAHVFTSDDAAGPIKSYSPDLIVHASWSGESSAEEAARGVAPWLASLHALVVGPGLGRSRHATRCAIAIITLAMRRDMPIVVDGDGLYLALHHPDLLRGYRKAVFSPNVVEWKRFVDAGESAQSLGVSIVQKGNVDQIIIAGRPAGSCDTTGSMRRCGGQGDLLAGAIATFSAWAELSETSVDPHVPLWAACDLVRESSRAAFAECGRATLATDILAKIGPTFNTLYDQ